MIDSGKVFNQVRVWAGAFLLDAVILSAVVEFLRLRSGGFNGMALSAPLGTFRALFFGISFCQFFLARLARNAVLNGRATVGSQDRALVGQMAVMVGLAISEVSVLLGFVFYLMSGSRSDFYIFAVISLVCLILMIPRRSDWDEWMSATGGNEKED